MEKQTKWLLVNPELASGAAELRRAGRAEARRAMQVHAPPSARGGAPPALPGFVLGPWPRLAPAEGDAASSPECASGAPRPLRGCYQAGSEGAPRSLPGRARRRRAAPSPGVAAPGPRQLMQSFARGAARVKRRCLPLLRPLPLRHTPPSLLASSLKG